LAKGRNFAAAHPPLRSSRIYLSPLLTPAAASASEQQPANIHFKNALSRTESRRRVIYGKVSWAHTLRVCLRRGISIGSVVFAQFTRVPNTQTRRHTLHARYMRHM